VIEKEVCGGEELEQSATKKEGEINSFDTWLKNIRWRASKSLSLPLHLSSLYFHFVKKEDKLLRTFF